MTDSDEISSVVDEALKLIVDRLGPGSTAFVVAFDPSCVDPDLSAWAASHGDPSTIAHIVIEGFKRLRDEAQRKPLMH